MGSRGRNLGVLLVPFLGNCERGPHPTAVVGERTNDRMLVEERQWLLAWGTAFEKLANRLELKRTVGERRFTSLVQRLARMPLAQCQEALKYAHSRNSSGF